MEIKPVKLPIFIAMMFFLTSCQMVRQQKPVLHGSSCAPPCWYQITPGRSSIDDVKGSLDSIPLIDPKTVLWGDQLSSLTPRATANFLDGSLVFIYFFNDTVACIYFSGSIGYTFGEAVELFGEPEYITAFRSPGNGRAWYSPFPGGADLIVVKAILPENGVAHGYYTSVPFQRLHREIRAKTELSDLIFYDRAHFDELADQGFFLTGEFNLQETQAAMIPWRGYKEIGTDYPFAKPLDKK